MGYNTKTAVTNNAGVRKRYGVRDLFLIMPALACDENGV